MNINQFIDFTVRRVLDNTPFLNQTIFTRDAVIELMKQWQEYNDVGRMLYSFNPSLKQDELGIFTEDDFLTYLTNKNETN